MTTCEECREIVKELKGYLTEIRSVLEQGHKDRRRVVEAMRGGETDAHMVEEFFATAPRPRAGTYAGMVQAYKRKFEHERRTGHRVMDLPRWPL